MSDVLLALVSCDALRGQFPRGVPRRGCVRRALERVREGKDWAPRHPVCAGCELGRQVRAEVEAAGVVLGVCGRHGAALVGEDRCEACTEDTPARRERPPCLECGSTSKHAAWCSRPGREPQTRAGGAREGRPVVALRGAPVSTVIWGEHAPDAPIAAPPRQGIGLSVEDVQAAAERVRESLRHPTAVASPPAGAEFARRIDPPAQVAVEEATPRAVVGIVGGHEGLAGGTDASAVRLAAPRLTAAWSAVMTENTCRCGCGRQLRKNNTTGFSGYCNTNRYAAGERPARPSRAKESTMPCRKCGKDGHNARGCTEKKAEAVRSASRGARHEERRVTGRVDLSEMTREDLVSLREAIDVELDQRIERAEADAAAYRAARGKAA